LGCCHCSSRRDKQYDRDKQDDGEEQYHERHWPNALLEAPGPAHGDHPCSEVIVALYIFGTRWQYPLLFFNRQHRRGIDRGMEVILAAAVLKPGVLQGLLAPGNDAIGKALFYARRGNGRQGC